MGLLGAAALGRTINKKMKSGIEQIGNVEKDVKSSHMYGSLADVDREEQDNLVSEYQPQTEDKNTFDSESTFENMEDQEEDVLTDEPIEDSIEKENEFEGEPIEGEASINPINDMDDIISENEFTMNSENEDSEMEQENLSPFVEEPLNRNQQDKDENREDSKEINLEDSEMSVGQDIENVVSSIPEDYEESEQNGVIRDEQNPNLYNKEESHVVDGDYQNISSEDSENYLEGGIEDEVTKDKKEKDAPLLTQNMGQVEEKAEKESSDGAILTENEKVEPLEKSAPYRYDRKNEEQENIQGQKTQAEDYEIKTPSDVVKQVENDLVSQELNQGMLKQQKADLQLINQEIKRELLDEEKGSPEYAALEREQAGNSIQMAKIDQQIQIGNQQKKELQDKLDYAKQVYGYSGDYDQRRAEILAKQANVNNFEMPEFRGVLTNEDKERLYKQRAIRNGVKVAAKTGAVVGTGVVLGSAGVFVPTLGVRMASAGIEIGDYAADKAVDVIGSAKDTSVHMIYNAKDGVTNGMDRLKTGSIKKNQNNGNETIPPVQTTVTKSQVIHETEKDTEPSKKETINHIEQEVKQPVVNQTSEKEKSNNDMDEKEQLSEQTFKHLQNELVSAFNENGTVASSLALKAIQEANIKADKYFASCKEKKQMLSAEEMQEKRIELQTDQLTEQLLSKLELENEDAKEGEKAKSVLKEKIKKIITKKIKVSMKISWLAD